MPAATRIPPIAWIPPPLLFGVTFLAGFFLQRRLSLEPVGSVPGPLRILGVVLTVGGALLALAALGLFARQRTTLIPHRESSSMVLQGPYRVTRNPMYLGFALAYIGLALWIGAWWALALLPVPVILLDRIIIPMEEAQLTRRFGEVYAEYSRRVRRWI